MSAAARPSIWRAFTQPAAWTMFFFGFASGMPFLLVAGTLAYWLKENGIELRNITLQRTVGRLREDVPRRQAPDDIHYLPAPPNASPVRRLNLCAGKRRAC